MDTLTVLNDRRPHSGSDGPNTVEAGRTLAVTATYVLTEEGRKALLLAGGDGRAVQEMVLEVPSNRLHLVSVDANGVARLKLRPRKWSRKHCDNGEPAAQRYSDVHGNGNGLAHRHRYIDKYRECCGSGRRGGWNTRQ